jgi:hypothetical protein
VHAYESCYQRFSIPLWRFPVGRLSIVVRPPFYQFPLKTIFVLWPMSAFHKGIKTARIRYDTVSMELARSISGGILARRAIKTRGRNRAQSLHVESVN